MSTENEMSEDMRIFRSELNTLDGAQSEVQYAVSQIDLNDMDLEMELEDALLEVERVITEIQESQGWI